MMASRKRSCDEGSDFFITENEATFDLDLVYGDEGNDIIKVREEMAGAHTVSCGPGQKDTVFFDEGTDTTSRSSEIRKPG
jgi:hypothetical protein